jgi:hypothetical protein
MFKFLRKTLLYIVLAPYMIFGLGAASNQLVIIANNNTFPVRINPFKLSGSALTVIEPSPAYSHGTTLMDEEHCVMTEHTHLNWLADNFDFNSEGIWSVGDLLIVLSQWMLPFSFPVWVGAFFRKVLAE